MWALVSRAVCQRDSRPWAQAQRRWPSWWPGQWCPTTPSWCRRLWPPAGTAHLRGCACCLCSGCRSAQSCHCARWGSSWSGAWRRESGSSGLVPRERVSLAQSPEVLWQAKRGRGYLIGFGAKSCQAFLGDVDLQRLQGLDQDVEADVELELVDEQGLVDVLLDHRLLGLRSRHQFQLARVPNEVDAVTLRSAVRLHDEGWIQSSVLLFHQATLQQRSETLPRQNYTAITSHLLSLCRDLYTQVSLKCKYYVFISCLHLQVF